MTNLERYNKIVKHCLYVKDEDLNDEVLAYNRHHNWDSVSHIEMIAALEDKFGVTYETLDIMSFNTYTAGIEILRKMGVDI